MTNTACAARAGLFIGLIGLATITPPAAIVTAQTVTRVENTSTSVSYSGDWELGNTDRFWSGGTAAVSTAALARATLAFTGTRVSWTGFRGPQAGIARVFLDGALVATVDTFADEEELAAQLFTAGGLANAAHTLAIEIAGDRNPSAINNYIVVDFFDVTTGTTGGGGTFAPGDVFVSLENGPVQWRRSDGTLFKTLNGAIAGTGEGMAFDAAGRLYVTRWRLDHAPATTGNTTEVFDVRGESLGSFGTGYDCDPHAIVFASSGAAYVGQAGCSGAVLKFAPGQPPVQFAVAWDFAGSFWIDLAPDGCTLFYTSWGPNVKRFNVCTGVQRSNFNRAPLPGAEGHDLRVLPDGGVLVSSGEVIARLNASGTRIATYSIPGEWRPWTGLDLVGDGTFWAGNYESSNVYRFDLATGAVVDYFNTGTPRHTVVGIRVKK
jgi:hypothetical protein